MNPDILALGPIWYVSFLFALTCHEAAHAWVAKLGGDFTAYEGGQVSLNPIPHIRRSPFGTVVVPIVMLLVSGWMLGWASAPYDPHWQRRYPKRAALMALAGPMSNFILVLSMIAIMRIGLANGFFAQPDYFQFTNIVEATAPGIARVVAVFVSITFSLNLLLGVFNLIPVPPLDGSTAIALILPENLALKYAELCNNQAFALLGIVAAWRLIEIIFAPVFLGASALIYG
ncbi:site-2 protease family protein [candidate division KSB1 bacterium]|nr:site-2 protease family protein [candidate division KSB1 bacterium]